MMTSSENLNIPVQNFGEFMVERMRRFGDAEALIDSLIDVTYTYRQAAERICRIATGLQRIGVKERDVVAMVIPNSIDYPLTFFAVAMIGGVFQPLNPLSTKDDISWAVRMCDSKFIITLADLAEKVVPAVEQTNAKVIVFGSKEGCISFQSLLKDDGPPTMPTDVDYKTTPAILFQTSGTTGRQKFVMHGHYSLIANIIQMYTATVSKMKPSKDRTTMIAFLPMFHVYCLHSLSALSLAHGARIVVMATFAPDLYLQLIQKYKATVLHLIPPVMNFLSKSPLVPQFNLSSVRSVFCGVTSLPPDVEEMVKNVLKVDIIAQTYAMTETLITHIPSGAVYKPGSSGVRLPSTDVQIVDVESGKPVASGEQGEITVRGPQVALGYINLPDETAHVFREDGWVYTGDMGYLDDDGVLFIVARLKDLIKYNGLQVSPVVLEDILLTHSGISDAAVVGVPDEEAGELPKAFVVRKAGCDVSEDEIKTFIADRVAPHMFLRGGVLFTDQIPRNATGKTMRNKLK